MHPEQSLRAPVNLVEIRPLTSNLLPAAVALDRCCLGGLWTLEGYRRELDSPNSDLLILQAPSTHLPTSTTETSTAVTSTAVDNLEGADPQPDQGLIGLGCLWSILEEAHITILAVHPAYQRQGLGQALLCALLESAWQRGLEWATLEVRPSNQAALSLYQKLGFQEVGRRRGYYENSGQDSGQDSGQNSKEDALILWRSGLQRPEFCETLQSLRQQVSDRLTQSGWELKNWHKSKKVIKSFS